MHRTLCLLACVAAFAAENAPPPKPVAPAKSAPPVRPGVKTPGVQAPMSTLKPDAVFPVEGTPDWLAVDKDSVWVSNKPKNTVHRLDATSNKVTATVTVGTAPCSGLAIGFDSLWVPNCGDKTLSRVSLKDNKVIATVPVGPAHTEGGITASPDSVWMLTDEGSKLARIDPATNLPVVFIPMPAGSYAAVYGDGAVWVSSHGTNQVARVDPRTNLITDLIETGPQPRFLTFGAGAVWTLNQGDGTVTRIDAAKKTVAATIELGIPGGGGEIAFGADAIWVTIMQYPLARIEISNNKVSRQFAGPGGDSVRSGHGSLWLSNIREQNVWRLPAPTAP